MRVLLGLIGVTAGVMVLLGGRWWSVYDARHPKRVGFQYAYNVSPAFPHDPSNTTTAYLG
jgi:hypothetical protein